MGHTIDIITSRPALSAPTQTKSDFLRALAAMRKAFYNGSRLIVYAEFFFLGDDYAWAEGHLSALLSEMRACAIANPADYFLPESEYMEKGNGDEYDAATVKILSHDVDCPHRIHIRNRVYPF